MFEGRQRARCVEGFPSTLTMIASGAPRRLKHEPPAPRASSPRGVLDHPITPRYARSGDRSSCLTRLHPAERVSHGARVVADTPHGGAKRMRSRRSSISSRRTVTTLRVPLMAQNRAEATPRERYPATPYSAPTSATLECSPRVRGVRLEAHPRRGLAHRGNPCDTWNDARLAVR